MIKLSSKNHLKPTTPVNFFSLSSFKYFSKNHLKPITHLNFFLFLPSNTCHPGDCFLYLSDSKQEGQVSPSKWFKIFEYPGCGAPDGRGPPNKQYISKTFTVPEGVPECKDCVLRWEWYSVKSIQIEASIQYY
eukprot:Pgem_evm2s6882